MILTGPEIKEQVKKGRIWIEPFVHRLINPNSYNYRLADRILELTGDHQDIKKASAIRSHRITKKGFVLYPGKIYLAHTHEILGSSHFVTSLIGRSTIGRLGLWLQVCADLGHVDSRHRWTLEMKVVQPLRIYPRMEIGQVSFWKISGNAGLRYKGLYQSNPSVSPSLLFKSLKP